MPDKRTVLEKYSSGIPTHEAKLKDAYDYPRAQACAGQEFLKGKWIPVPVGREEEADNTDFLDVREIKAVNGAYSDGVVKKAKKLKVDLSEVEGSGAKGKILVKDVDEFAKERDAE